MFVDLSIGKAPQNSTHSDIFDSSGIHAHAQIHVKQRRHPALYIDPARCWSINAGHDAKQGGLARSIGTHESNAIAMPHLETDIAQSVHDDMVSILGKASPDRRSEKQLSNGSARYIVDWDVDRNVGKFYCCHAVRPYQSQ